MRLSRVIFLHPVPGLPDDLGLTKPISRLGPDDGAELDIDVIRLGSWCYPLHTVACYEVAAEPEKPPVAKRGRK